MSFKVLSNPDHYDLICRAAGVAPWGFTPQKVFLSRLKAACQAGGPGEPLRAARFV